MEQLNSIFKIKARYEDDYGAVMGRYRGNGVACGWHRLRLCVATDRMSTRAWQAVDFS